jgi:hypothetical protein
MARDKRFERFDDRRAIPITESLERSQSARLVAKLHGLTARGPSSAHREPEFVPNLFGRECLTIGWFAVELGKRHELLRLWLDLLGEECKQLRDVASGGRGDDVRRDLHGPAHRPFPRRVAIAPVWAKPRWVLSPVPAPGASSPRAARLPMTQNIP